MTQALRNFRQYLLSGVSFAIPLIACGGILIALSVAFAMTPHGPDFTGHPTLQLVNLIGATAFQLMLPVLAGYIANAMAGKPALAPGFIGGFLAGNIPTPDGVISAGFLGAMAAGLIAGLVVLGIKRWKPPAALRPVMPILVIPMLASLIVGFLMLKVIGIPIAHLFEVLGAWLNSMSTGNAVVLAAVLGAMIAFDMGGPVNKAAFFFGSAMLTKGNALIMGPIAAAICTPPLGLGLATLFRSGRWSEEEREAGRAALAMGMIGITEGAIPFAAADPIRVIPCIMLGSMAASMVAMVGGVGDHAPHGGPIVLLVIDHRLIYVAAIVIGMAVTAVAVHAVRFWARATPAEAS
jgi:fructose-specific phosphotransferase system IIC component